MKLEKNRKFNEVLRNILPKNLCDNLEILLRNRSYRFGGSKKDFIIESIEKNLLFYGVQVDEIENRYEKDLLPLDNQEPYPAELVWLGGYVFLIEFNYECSADGLIGKEDVKTVLGEYRDKLKEEGICSSIGIQTSIPKKKPSSNITNIVHARFISYHVNPNRIEDFIPLAKDIKEEFGVGVISIHTTYLCGATAKKDAFTWKSRIYV